MTRRNTRLAVHRMWTLLPCCQCREDEADKEEERERNVDHRPDAGAEARERFEVQTRAARVLLGEEGVVGDVP
jgi:hypothetical protein